MMEERSGKPVLGVCAQPGKGARGRCSARVPECDLTPSCAARVPPDDAGARAGRCVSNVEKLCQVSDPTAQWRFSPPLKFRSRKVKTFFLFLPLPPPPCPHTSLHPKLAPICRLCYNCFRFPPGLLEGKRR